MHEILTNVTCISDIIVAGSFQLSSIETFFNPNCYFGAFLGGPFRIRHLNINLYCWFQTSLLLRRLIIACHFMVTAATPLWLIIIAPKLNRIQQSAVWRCGQSDRVIDWQDAACCLVILLWLVALAQLYKYHH